MVMDDHDVTDDWFLNGKVNEILRKGRPDDGQPSTGGRRLMRNALIAYTLFQHWGNVPGEFDLGTPAGQLLELVDLGVLTIGGPGSSSPPIALSGREDDLDVILDVCAEPIGADRADERIRWDYEIMFPDHRLIVLDTRTWRVFPEAIVDVSVDDLLSAAEERTAELSDWGTTELHGIAAAWSSAAAMALAAGDRSLGDFLGSGAALIEHAASLADSADSGDPRWPQLAEGVVDQASGLLVALGVTTAAQHSAWAPEALDDAEAKLAWCGPREPRARSAPRCFALRRASRRPRSSSRPGAGRDRALRRLGDHQLLRRRRGGDLAGRGVPARRLALPPVGGRVARHGGAKRRRLAAAWVTLAYDLGRVLFAGARPQSVAALDQAASASSAFREAFAVVEHGWKDYVDPVWEVLVGSGTTTLNAELISGDALQFQVVERLAQPTNVRPLTIVVSPAPVFDHPLVFFLVRGVIAMARRAGWRRRSGRTSPGEGARARSIACSAR